MSDPTDKIEVRNVTTPGHVYRVDRAKYEAMRGVFLSVLPAAPPGMTPAEVLKAMQPLLDQTLFPGGAKSGWWMKCVQLDLEFKGTVARAPNPPVRLHRVTPA
jgi:hypothetical protein